MSLFVRLFSVPVIIFAAYFLTACSSAPQPLLRVAAHVWPGYETLNLARSLGYYDGAPIRLVETTSASASSTALRNGIVDAAALTLDEALSLMQDGIDLRVVLVMDVSNGADVLLARPGISNLHALRGKRVGVENSGTGAVMLDAALHAANLQVEDVRLVPLTVDEHLAAWRAGKVDALVTFDPLRTQLLAQGAGVLFDSRQIPGRIVDVLVVRGEVVEQQHAALQTLVAGHFLALDHMRQQPRDAATRMAPRLGTAPAQVMSQFEYLVLPDIQENRRWLTGAAPELQTQAANLGRLMLNRHLLQRPVRVDQLATPIFLP